MVQPASSGPTRMDRTTRARRPRGCWNDQTTAAVRSDIGESRVFGSTLRRDRESVPIPAVERPTCPLPEGTTSRILQKERQ